ncbi:hypothetical protein [Azohydromonas lata]|uniref:DUF2946 domain-containing protein n=1 Tax=Azohydromonas lata TaxID=45677 RepID=A0ABU5I946_9BURK|nr:hypothetical protein [Azohydromonas lata]MDZ5455626.1 hypothetical protein [Azohydromonas lata]
MWRLFRIAMMWLLAVALPLQGSVAATLRVCGPGHDRMAVAAAVIVEHDHAAHHHDAAAASAHDDTATQNLHQNAQHKCSACAACCVTAALPASVVRFEAVVDAAAPPPVLADSPAVFLTDGPERPPRLLLA